MLSELYGSIRGFVKISRPHYPSSQNIEAVPREIAIAPFSLVKVEVFFFFLSLSRSSLALVQGKNVCGLPLAR